MELSTALIREYLPYAKGVIVARAIPSIDGLKPSQRRILYTMKKMGLNKGANAKSSRIVGDAMKVHPHGDQSIYATMVSMTNGNENWNVPFIRSKGSFGKVYSSNLRASAPRYTEARLMPIADELFDGLDENAVDMIPNFDNTMLEPALLPVKFPNILVNTSNGVAVGTSSNIPTFALGNVCDATIGVIKGTVKTPAELAAVLKCPEYTTGGFVHTDDAMMIKLCETGIGNFKISGKVQLYPDKIVVTEIPYVTTIEDISDAIEAKVKEGELKEIRDVKNQISKDGFGMTILLKSNKNSREVLQKLCRYTKLRADISYKTRVIINNRCVQLGLLDLIKEWISFRSECVRRAYSYKLVKSQEKEHQLSTWEIIRDYIPEVVDTMSHNKEAEARALIKDRFKLDDIQMDYLFDLRLRSITTDNADKNIKKLNDMREEVAGIQRIATDENARLGLIAAELADIKANYACEARTTAAPVIKEEKENTKPVINDEAVAVVFTANGYIKRLTTINELTSWKCPDGDKEAARLSVRNNEYILVFLKTGEVHKILVDSIDAGKKLSQSIVSTLHLKSMGDILYIDRAGDFSGYFNIIYDNGRGRKVYYDRLAGNRSKYKNMFEDVTGRNYIITKCNKFMLITANRKAAYCDIETLGIFRRRDAFKVATISSSDRLYNIQPYEKIPFPELIDFDRYSRGYTVKIKDDDLWSKEDEHLDPYYQARKLAEQKEAEEAAQKEAEEAAKESN